MPETDDPVGPETDDPTALPPIPQLLMLKNERDAFAEWLEFDAKRLLDLIQELIKAEAPKAFIDRFRAEVDAERLIARKLRGQHDGRVT